MAKSEQRGKLVSRERQEGAALRWKWRWLKGAGYLFMITVFLGVFVGDIYISSKLLLFALLVLVILAIGIPYSLLSGRIMQQEKVWLQHYGTTIQVPVIGIEKNVSSGGGGQALTPNQYVSYYLKLRWTSPSGRIYDFKQKLEGSQYLDPKYAPGTLLTVSIDPDDPSFYQVILS